MSIDYSKFRYYKIEDSDLDDIEPEDSPYLGEGCRSRIVGIGIDEPAVQCCFEDFYPGATYKWTTWIDQLDFVTKGKAEITIVVTPELAETKTFIVEAPSVYLIPRGTPITWKVLGDEVFRHISVDIPNPKFPLTNGKSVKLDD